MIVFKQANMHICISTLLCLSYLCGNSFAVWNTMDVDAIQKLSTRLDFLTQKLIREHHQIHDVGDASSYVRDMENRIITLENTILQKKCGNKIQSLKETIQELSKQQKQNGLYYKRAEKLDAIVSYQENIISKLKDEVIQIIKINSIRRNALLSSEDNKDKDKKTEQDVHNRIGKVQSTNVSADLRNVVSRKSKV